VEAITEADLFAPAIGIGTAIGIRGVWQKDGWQKGGRAGERVLEAAVTARSAVPIVARRSAALELPFDIGSS
jgi:hypothetical protein